MQEATADAIAVAGRLVERARISKGVTLGDELGAWLGAEFARTGSIDYMRWLDGG